MSYNIFIITRCIDLSCASAATLVFDTIRVGFPANKITAIYLGDFPEIEAAVREKCKQHNLIFNKWSKSFKTNDQVIKYLVEEEKDDFAVVDSDMVFWKDLSWYKSEYLLSGRHVPSHKETFNNATTVERLHTSLMFFTNIPQLRKAIAQSHIDSLNGRFGEYDAFKPFITKYEGDTVFYDSCATLYHAVGGEAFTKEVLECYDHLNCGSYYNEIIKTHPEWTNLYNTAFSYPETLKGIYKEQRVYWFKSAFMKIKAELATRISEDALRFIQAYGDYVGYIDDLIDEPNNVETVAKTTEMAARLFSSNYWTANSTYLFLIEQVVHAIYFGAVKWEKSNEAWKRRDARVLNHCGYYLLIAIVLLETKDMKYCQEFTLDMLEKNHGEHMEDLTKEELMS